MILECSEANLRYVSSYFLSVSPVVTRLTVYRRLQVRGWGPRDPERLKTYSEILGRFFEKVEFF